jgi:hypothetical protein
MISQGRRPGRTAAALAAGLAIAATCSLAHAEVPSAASPKPGRYTMHPAEGGFMRLDTETGSVSHCGRTDGQWSCQSLADDRRAFEAEIDRLAKENTELKGAVRRLEDLAGLGDPNSGPNAGKDRRGEGTLPKLQLPTEADVDRALTYVQRIFKKFKDKIREFEDMARKDTDKNSTPL